MGKFRQFLTSYLPVTSDFSYPDNNLSKYRWIFTKLGNCIAIVKIWFRIVCIDTVDLVWDCQRAKFVNF